MQELSKEKLKDLRKLRLKKFRDEKKQVLVEGSRTIRQLITDRVSLSELYCLESAVKSYTDILEHIGSERIYVLKEHQIEQLTAAKSAQNIIALVECRVPDFRKMDRLVYIDRISDPGNLGAIFRNARATGMDGVILSPECSDIFNPKTVRASVGTLFSLPSKVSEFEQLQGLDKEIIITDSEKGEPLFSFPLPENGYILVLGSEAFGVDRRIVAKADRRIRIPMLNRVESLNVAVAAGLCMYRLNRDILTK